MGAAFALIGILVVAQPASAATLLVNANGQLIGATGVNVEGTLYDVAFVDGTCIELFSGCDDAAADFTFTTLSSAQAASQALLDQVFLGIFDTDPTLTFGCTNISNCQAYTPHDVDFLIGHNFYYVAITGAANYHGSSNLADFTGSNGTRSETDFRSNPTFVYADWTPAAAAAVPEPASLLLLGTGLVGAGVRRWRQRGSTLWKELAWLGTQP